MISTRNLGNKGEKKLLLKGGPTHPRTLLLGFAISKTTRDIFMQQLARERT